jgi:uncharacterized protein YciI
MGSPVFNLRWSTDFGGTKMVWKMVYFVVINEQGPAWDSSRLMRDQEKWTEHAVFVNALAEEGFIMFAGPLGGGPRHRALLIVDAENEATVRSRFAEDPWMQLGVLRVFSVEPWEVLVGPEAILGR